MLSESKILQEIRLSLSKAGCTMFRNNTGKLQDARGRWVTFGLHTGSSDLIGYRNKDGKFVAIEVKRPGKNATAEQHNFIQQVKANNGLAGVAHNTMEALIIVGVI